MAVDIKTLKIRLIEAEDAYHQLLIGTKEVSVNVGNFGSVSYNQTSRTALEAYISSLKSQIAAAEGTNVGRRRIIRVSFQSSLGKVTMISVLPKISTSLLTPLFSLPKIILIFPSREDKDKSKIRSNGLG